MRSDDCGCAVTGRDETVDLGFALGTTAYVRCDLVKGADVVVVGTDAATVLKSRIHPDHHFSDCVDEFPRTGL